ELSPERTSSMTASSSVVTPTIKNPLLRKILYYHHLKPTSFVFPTTTEEKLCCLHHLLVHHQATTPPPPPPCFEESSVVSLKENLNIASSQEITQTLENDKEQMKVVEMEEGEIVMEVDQTMEISTVPDDIMQKNIKDIDTGNEEEIEEEMIRKKMVELGRVLQQETITEGPKRQLKIMAFSPPGGFSKKKLFILNIRLFRVRS
ncbi:hypothetical protein KI387_039196, partial [Taxus chinensis]